MSAHIVIFQTNDEQTRQQVIKTLKSFGSWAKITDCSYVSRGSATAFQKRDILNSLIQDADRIFIANIEDCSWASANLPKEVNKYLHDV